MKKIIPPLISLDLETTGLSPRYGARICEISLVQISDGKIREHFTTLVNPEHDIPQMTTELTGITNRMVRKAPTFRKIIPEVKQILASGKPILAHNARFDLSFLNFECAFCGEESPSNPVIDTLKIARRHFFFYDNSLGGILERFGISCGALHRAYQDAVAAYLILEEMCRYLKPREAEFYFSMTARRRYDER
jgi:DNA polymerase III epsilon subunit family exonuclease